MKHTSQKEVQFSRPPQKGSSPSPSPSSSFIFKSSLWGRTYLFLLYFPIDPSILKVLNLAKVPNRVCWGHLKRVLALAFHTLPSLVLRDDINWRKFRRLYFNRGMGGMLSVCLRGIFGGISVFPERQKTSGIVKLGHLSKLLWGVKTVRGTRLFWKLCEG